MSLRMIEPGLSTLVVDLGRPNYRSLGVPIGGAFDRTSLCLGNALVGNPPEVAALEIALAGPVMRANRDLACVLFGAPFRLITIGPASTVVVGKTFTLRAGQEVRIGAAPSGSRAYFCIRGGIHAERILGSRSAFGTVRSGDEVPCDAGTIPPRFLPPRRFQEHRPIRVVAGPQAAWFSLAEFYAQEFRVSESSNRVGIRLAAEPLSFTSREMASEPVCPGSVEVTPDRQCIILGVDGPTIGGYPKIAQVISADMDRIGQLRPGDRVSFASVSLDEAESLYARRQRELREWIIRLRETLPG